MQTKKTDDTIIVEDISLDETIALTTVIKIIEMEGEIDLANAREASNANYYDQVINLLEEAKDHNLSVNVTDLCTKIEAENIIA